MKHQTKPHAFTLVELLVVISIIGVLMALLLPAVQSARESGRRTQCLNNLKQIGLAAQSHLQAQGFFPTGGWNHEFVGDPDMGFTERQPGGWNYTLLPYLEEGAAFGLGRGADNTTKLAAGKAILETPISAYYCPTPRSPQAYPSNVSFKNASAVSAGGKTDYAACVGGFFNNGSIDVFPPTSYLGTTPATVAAGKTFDWVTEMNKNTGIRNGGFRGLIYMRSMVKSAKVHDGISKTLLFGEKALATQSYENATNPRNFGDDENAMSGFNSDQYRRTMNLPNQDAEQTVSDYDDFGGPHTAVFNVALGDGSIHSISYSIDLAPWRSFGIRDDGGSISGVLP